MKNYSLPTSSSNIRQPVAFRGAGGVRKLEFYYRSTTNSTSTVTPVNSSVFATGLLFSHSTRRLLILLWPSASLPPAYIKITHAWIWSTWEPGWNITAKALSIFLILFPHVCHGPSAIVPLWQFFWCSLQLSLAFCSAPLKQKESWQILFVQIFYFRHLSQDLTVESPCQIVEIDYLPFDRVK